MAFWVNWSEIICQIGTHLPTSPLTMNSDMAVEPVKSRFYELEIEKAQKSDDDPFDHDPILRYGRNVTTISRPVSYRGMAV